MGILYVAGWPRLFFKTRTCIRNCTEVTMAQCALTGGILVCMVCSVDDVTEDKDLD